MFDRLPDLFDPLEFVEKKRRIKGRMLLSSLDRVQDILLNPEGEVQVDLEFRREGRIPAIEGSVTAELTLQCQCCLEPLVWPVHSRVQLGVVGSIDEISILPEEFEPTLVEAGGRVALADIVQDELLHPFSRLAELKKNYR
jgi:uncharacterized protein